MRKIDSSTGQPAYQQFLDYLFGLEKFGMVFGLTQVQKILEAIGNPHREVQSIHIGGTNGKGSTAAMTASILQREGYRVGLYTSPHLIRFTERIKVNGKEIEKEEVAALAGWMKERIEAAGLTSSSTGTCPGSPALKGGVKGYNMMKPACREASPLRAGSFTFFDFTTAMALYYFKQKMVDLAVLEVGLGGRLDSTNVVDPLFSVITNVSKDHEAYLGNSVLKIAGEKAGIIKKGRPLITAAKQPQVLRLFSKVCREKGSPYYRVGRDFRYERTVDGEFHYEGLRRKLWGLRLNLKGFHQIINATTALGAMEVLEDLGYPVSTDAMLEGLREVDWPGRLEMVASSPKVVLDGAHNPDGALVLREALIEEFQYRHLILLIGMMKDKDFKSVLHLLSPLADRIILTKPNTDRAAPPALLKKVLGRRGNRAEVIEDLKEAVERGLSITGGEDLLCVTGSLYTVGEVRAYFRPRGRT